MYSSSESNTAYWAGPSSCRVCMKFHKPRYHGRRQVKSSRGTHARGARTYRKEVLYPHQSRRLRRSTACLRSNRATELTRMGLASTLTASIVDQWSDAWAVGCTSRSAFYTSTTRRGTFLSNISFHTTARRVTTASTRHQSNCSQRIGKVLKLAHRPHQEVSKWRPGHFNNLMYFAEAGATFALSGGLTRNCRLGPVPLKVEVALGL